MAGAGGGAAARGAGRVVHEPGLVGAGHAREPSGGFHHARGDRRGRHGRGAGAVQCGAAVRRVVSRGQGVVRAAVVRLLRRTHATRIRDRRRVGNPGEPGQDIRNPSLPTGVEFDAQQPLGAYMRARASLFMSRLSRRVVQGRGVREVQHDFTASRGVFRGDEAAPGHVLLAGVDYIHTAGRLSVGRPDSRLFATIVGEGLVGIE